MPTSALRSTSLPIEIVDCRDQPRLRMALANAGVPRVLLVEPGSEPPLTLGVDEGWAFTDATDVEIDRCARDVLERLAASEHVELVDERMWSHAGRPFRLTRLQARLFAELVANRGRTVTHQRLKSVGWLGGSVNQASLDGAMQRLRGQLVGTGLHVRSSRCIGFALA